jgi:hypothetical protein
LGPGYKWEKQKDRNKPQRSEGEGLEVSKGEREGAHEKQKITEAEERREGYQRSDHSQTR